MEQEFLNRLYAENRTNLALYINSIIYSKSHDDIEDCLQETFLIVIRKSKTSDIADHPDIKGWLFTIAKNVSYKFNTAYMKRKSLSTSEIEIKHQDFTDQLLEDIIYSEIDQENLLNDIESGLTTSEREIFELRQQNFKYKEIAEILNKSESTVKSTYSRLKPKIESIIKEVLP